MEYIKRLGEPLDQLARQPAPLAALATKGEVVELQRPMQDLGGVQQLAIHAIRPRGPSSQPRGGGYRSVYPHRW